MRLNNGTGRQALTSLCVPALLALLSWSSVPAQVPLAGVVHSGPARVEESDPSVIYAGV